MIEAVGGEGRDAASAGAEASDQRQPPPFARGSGFGGRGGDIFFGKLEEKPVFAVVLHRRSPCFEPVRSLQRYRPTPSEPGKSDLHLDLPTRAHAADRKSVAQG